MLIKIGDLFVDPAEIAAVRDGYTDVDGVHYVDIFLRGHETMLMAAAAGLDEAEAALIDAGFIEDPADDPSALIAEELPLLEELAAEGYKFLARDIDGKLYAYRHRPSFDGAYWNPVASAGDEAKSLGRESCPFVDAEDEEPFCIADVIS